MSAKALEMTLTNKRVNSSSTPVDDTCTAIQSGLVLVQDTLHQAVNVPSSATSSLLSTFFLQTTQYPEGGKKEITDLADAEQSAERPQMLGGTQCNSWLLRIH